MLRAVLILLVACRVSDDHFVGGAVDGGHGDGHATMGDGAMQSGDGPPGTCTLVPQTGCSGAAPACDIAAIDGTTHCRAVTSPGMATSTCAMPQQCAAGYTCVQEDSAHWCHKFCNVDAHCAPSSGSRCLIDVDGPGPLGQKTCTNACTLVTQTGCPSGLGCVGLPGMDTTNCAPVGTGHQDAVCTTDGDCAAGFLCVELDPQLGSRCGHYCADSSDCSTGSCHFLSPAITVGGVEYGWCF